MPAMVRSSGRAPIPGMVVLLLPNDTKQNAVGVLVALPVIDWPEIAVEVGVNTIGGVPHPVPNCVAVEVVGGVMVFSYHVISDEPK